MASTEWEVVEGDNIWNIAAETLMTPQNPQPSMQDIVVRMEELIKLNLDTLKASPGKGNPSLIYPGMKLKLTAAPAPGDAAKKGRVDDGASLPEKGEETKGGDKPKPGVDIPIGPTGEGVQGRVDDGASLPQQPGLVPPAGGTRPAGMQPGYYVDADGNLIGPGDRQVTWPAGTAPPHVRPQYRNTSGPLKMFPERTSGQGMALRGGPDPSTYPPKVTERNLTDERNARLGSTPATRPQIAAVTAARNFTDERNARTTAARNAPGRNLSDERDARLSRLPTGARGQNVPR